MNKNVIAVFAVTMALLGTSATRHRVALPPPDSIPLNLSRSFAVTDVGILQGFPFVRVVDAIAARSGVPGATGAQLVQQMYDTQSPRPGMVDPSGPHCDDFVTFGTPSFNTFPRRCPTPEAKLAAVPLGVYDYVPLALVNRFDMAPPDGANCGQYRMIYVTYPAPDKPPFNHRIHVILESVLPNPHPEQGIVGCRAVAQFWADLSSVDSMSERRARLEKFFFDGIDGFEPAVHPDHYSLPSGGGIRTRENLQGSGVNGPRFYQFRLSKECPTGSACTLRLVPDVLENTPWGPLFNSSNDFFFPAAVAFRKDFISQVKTLALDDVNQFRMNVPRQFLMGEADFETNLANLSYVRWFRDGERLDGGKFRGEIDAELKRIGSNLTPDVIVARAETQACHGCHAPTEVFGGGVPFPAAVPGFGHVDDLTKIDGDGGPNSRFQISPAMRDVFIPNRMRILREFLKSGKAPEHSN